ncbi:MAG: hypothetical protein AB1665_07290, partial [Candidatus Thermoplasmatota archaeon]
EYLKTGGFPRSVRDYSRYGRVTVETAKTYLDWLRGDWARAGKSDKFMKEILSYLIRAGGTPVSWNSISAHTGITSPNTVRSYIEILEGIYSVLVLNFITPDRRVDYKKNKKIHFTDPFVFKVISDFVGEDVAGEWLLEAIVACHIARLSSVYYWRDHTEVDVVCVQDKELAGFEVTKGLKRWRPPWHVRRAYLLDRDNIHMYLAALRCEVNDSGARDI